MASIFFDDYHFPSELYNRDANDFSTPIRTLLDYTPHILQNLPKENKDQEPIQPTKDRSFEFMNEHVSKKNQKTHNNNNNNNNRSNTNENNNKSNNSNYINYAAGFAKFLAECCVEYAALSAKHPSNKTPSPNKNNNTHQEKPKQQATCTSSSYSWSQRQQRTKEEPSHTSSTFPFTSFRTTTANDTNNNNTNKKEEDEQDEKKVNESTNEEKDQVDKTTSDTSANTAMKSAAAIGALTFSLYSTYQASVGYGDITLQNQLELLLEHVEANLRSTQIWLEERVKMDDPVPELIVSDMKRLRQLVDCLYRLDSRREKKIETAGWSVGLVGGLSALGGIAFGSATILTGGAAAAVGAVLVAVASRGSKKSIENIRILVEGQVHQVLNELRTDQKLRNEMLQSMATKSEQEAFEFIPSDASASSNTSQKETSSSSIPSRMHDINKEYAL
ncbi:hypothetical protein BDA99DRAFT_500112 [Phascolomyces articulosus]|uniref:Uncharacterized protein n=1 Tax=Phascolomyces articulosus TaxID=60185 RepID=A0AAD5K830_9FUNG|nr:hypothetical protein BDA99DRAFT_500112 [Phascolomyces articulosus]